MTVLIRAGTVGDDAACGEIVGTAGNAAIYAGRLPHARDVFSDTSPLTDGGRQRLIAETMDARSGSRTTATTAISSTCSSIRRRKVRAPARR